MNCVLSFLFVTGDPRASSCGIDITMMVFQFRLLHASPCWTFITNLLVCAFRCPVDSQGRPRAAMLLTRARVRVSSLCLTRELQTGPFWVLMSVHKTPRRHRTALSGSEHSALWLQREMGVRDRWSLKKRNGNYYFLIQGRLPGKLL